MPRWGVLSFVELVTSMGEPGSVAVPSPPDEVVSGLFRDHYRRLVGLACLLVGDNDAARDVVQDAFAGLYRRWGALRDPDSAVSYLNRAVVNGGRNELRRGRSAVARQLRLVPVSEGLVSAEGAVVAQEEADRLWQAICALPRRQRQVVVLRYYLDHSEAEIAETLGISRGSVKKAASRALASLGHCVEVDE
jgi:RNA polymerase sigma-70 factor (sigma-E family)